MDIQNEHSAVGIFALYAYFSGCIQGVELFIFKTFWVETLGIASICIQKQCMHGSQV